MTDKKLLHLLDQNPEEGISLLMEQYMGLLWSAGRLYLTNPEDIRECVQETFLDFYVNRQRFREEKGTVKAYLYVIAKRKAIRMAGQNGKQSAVPLEMLEEAAADSGEDAILNREALEQALGKLKEQDSRMIRMQYYDGLTCREIAEAMQLPVETVKKRQQRSLKKLRLALIAVVVLGLLGACAAAVIRFRFNPVTGIRDAEEEIYEGVHLPLEFQTKYGKAAVEYAVWKEQTLYLKLSADYPAGEQDEWLENISDQIWMEDEEGRKELNWGKEMYDPEEGRLEVQPGYFCREPRKEYELHMFGETVTIAMELAKEYDNLDDIGQAVTHKGRTLVVSGEWTDENTLQLNSWGHSEDMWKVGRPGSYRVTKEEMGKEGFVNWVETGLEESGSYEAAVRTPQGEPYKLTIPAVTLVATLNDEDAPFFEIPVPAEEGVEEADITFEVGNDVYRIGKVERTTHITRYDDGEEETYPELILYVEPVTLEKNTKLISLEGCWGEMRPGYIYSLNKETGELEMTGTTENFSVTGSIWMPPLYLDGGLEKYRRELTLEFYNEASVPDRLWFRVSKVVKTWNQEYTYTIK